MWRVSVVTGVGYALTRRAAGRGPASVNPSNGGVEPPDDLGGREMRHKDRASRLALRAVDRALADAGMAPGAAVMPSATIATLVSSNYGNLDSVCDFADRIAHESTVGSSPLGLPHVSSNAIAGWIATHHGLRGPSVTLCNGRTSGIDALYWADNLIGAGRADVVVVVGVEPDTPQVRLVLGIGPDASLLDGAAAVILESSAHAARRRATVRAVLGIFSRAAGIEQVLALFHGEKELPGLWLTPAALPLDVSGLIPAVDLTQWLGDCSGALGVLQCVAAVAHLDSGDPGPVYATCGGWPRGSAATLQLHSPRETCGVNHSGSIHLQRFKSDQEER